MYLTRQGEKFQIQWRESGRQKWVKRFNLLFEDENIEDFKARIHAALRRRQEVERDARYVSFVDQQPWQHPDILDERFQQRITHLAGPQLAAQLPQLTQSFIAEVSGLSNTQLCPTISSKLRRVLLFKQCIAAQYGSRKSEKLYVVCKHSRLKGMIVV